MIGGNRTRNRAILITALIFVLCGAAWAIYWWGWGRFYQYTDDAYVDGNNVTTTPQIDGIVESVYAMDADFVPYGKILVELDKTDARIALNKAIASLGLAVRHVVSLFENVEKYGALIEARKAEFIKAAQDFEHRKLLIEMGGVSLEDLEHAAATLKSSFFDLMATEHEYTSAFSQVQQTTIFTHPLVEQCKNGLREAFVTLERCTIKSAVAGIVAQRTVQVGEHVTAGKPLMAIVPLDQMWISANFKEVQLKNVRVGQPVKITADIYGRGVVFHGTVAGVGGGTGSVFSVLPPQNATGNWIKIVQRIPVRIMLQPEEIIQHPLRLGLSIEATIDIHDVNGHLLPYIRNDCPLFETNIFADQEEGAEPLIIQTIFENLMEKNYTNPRK